MAHQHQCNTEAIIHWSKFGRKGGPSTTRATAGDRQTEPFQKPVTSTWDQVIQRDDLPNILNGFVPEAMEDKWFIYAEGPDEQGNALLHMYRSWTGYKAAEVKLAIDLDKDGKFAQRDAHFTAVTWEADNVRHVGQTEGKAKSMVVQVCNWCLGAKISSKQVAESEQDGASVDTY
jgi:hypothetical protein